LFPLKYVYFQNRKARRGSLAQISGSYPLCPSPKGARAGMDPAKSGKGRGGIGVRVREVGMFIDA
jgi:hypothetical protein